MKFTIWNGSVEDFALSDIGVERLPDTTNTACYHGKQPPAGRSRGCRDAGVWRVFYVGRREATCLTRFCEIHVPPELVALWGMGEKLEEDERGCRLRCI